MKALIIALATTIATTAPAAPVEKRDGVYDVWATPGLHLVMDDNGTPDDYSDDWVIDYEDNRTVRVAVLDK